MPPIVLRPDDRESFANSKGTLMVGFRLHQPLKTRAPEAPTAIVMDEISADLTTRMALEIDPPLVMKLTRHHAGEVRSVEANLAILDGARNLHLWFRWDDENGDLMLDVADGDRPKVKARGRLKQR